MATEFRLPELGENIKSGDLIKMLVSAGDHVNQDQPVLELETDKATIEVPSPVSGTIQQVFVKDGEQIKVGQLIFTVDGSTDNRAAAAATQPAVEARETKPTEARAPKAPRPSAGESQAAARPRPAEAPRDTSKPAPPVEAVEKAEPAAPAVPFAEGPALAVPVPAAPSVRRTAREIGVDINEVPGSGPGGRISADDVKRHARELIRGRTQMPAGAAFVPLPDFSRWGAVERKAMSQVRRKTAEHLGQAWTTIPQVTQFDQADVTNLEEIRKQYQARAEKAGGKLTFTAITLKVVSSALRLFPQFAASIDMARGEIVYKKYCHVGVAVDTDRGLLVPVIRDVDKKNIIELSAELASAAEKARNKKISLEEMEGGVFTITNLGGIGGTYFSPIVNYPEVAILGISRARLEPVYLRGQFEPRLMLPLTLSYDHRIIDGADAARFLRWVAEALEQPFLLPLQG